MEEIQNVVFNRLKEKFQKHGLIYISQYYNNTEQSFMSVKEMPEAMKRELKNIIPVEPILNTEYEMLKDNEKVIKMLYLKIKELLPKNIKDINNEEMKEKRAELVLSISSLINLRMIRNNFNWEFIINIISQIMQNINIREFLNILDFSNNEELFTISWLVEIINKKIPEMSETEFFRLQEKLKKSGVDPKLFEKAISKRVELADSTFVPKYIMNSMNIEDVATILEKLKQEDSIEAIIYIIKSGKDTSLQEKVKVLIEGLSDLQVVRLMIFLEQLEYENQEIDELLERRVRKLSNDDFLFVVIPYLASEKEVWKERITKIAIEKKILLNENGEIFSENPIFLPENGYDEAIKENRFTMYWQYTGFPKGIRMLHLKWDFSDIPDSATSPEREKEEVECIINTYYQQNELIDIVESKVDYIRMLDAMNEKQLVQIIRQFKFFLPTNEGKRMLNLDELKIQFIRDSYLDVERYLYHRILEMKDKGAIVLLSTLFDNIDNEFFNSIIAAKFDECENEITDYIDDEGR